ncbi:hypothetical protein MMC29_003590 [Sticta canariensis]|nr:hypothetical protein [Sticta canariensis]
MWDDHDIFDGWGSYPERLQLCPMFQGLFSIARRFYLLFQHHTTLPRAQELSHLFGARNESYSFVKLLGPQVALVAPDSRSERSKKTIVSAESWNLIFDRMNNLPSSVQHVVLLTTVPVLYPKVRLG